MGIEIDIVNAGNADAIAIHLKDGARHWVAIIDGGYEQHGHELVRIVQRRYGCRYIDAIISTHPDKDHVTGLATVVKTFGAHGIGAIYVHNPWEHDLHVNPQSVIFSEQTTKRAKALAEGLERVTSFISLVDHLGIPRYEPFSGTRIGPLVVLGPSVEFYEQQLAAFRDFDVLQATSRHWEMEQQIDELQLLLKTATATLDEKEDGSAENQSSVITFLDWDGGRYLFTGDAGTMGLGDARSRWSFSSLHWLDVPHHGSKRSLSTGLVDYLAPAISYISAKGSRKHPSQAVVNALKRHGTVYSTHKGGALWHQRGFDIPDRADFSIAEPL